MYHVKHIDSNGKFYVIGLNIFGVKARQVFEDALTFLWDHDISIEWDVLNSSYLIDTNGEVIIEFDYSKYPLYESTTIDDFLFHSIILGKKIITSYKSNYKSMLLYKNKEYEYKHFKCVFDAILIDSRAKIEEKYGKECCKILGTPYDPFFQAMLENALTNIKSIYANKLKDEEYEKLLV